MKTSVITASALCLASAFLAGQAAAQTPAALKPVPTNLKPLPPMGPPTNPGLLASTGSDDCANAPTNDAISGAGVFAVDTTAATTGAPVGSCGLMGRDVWFYWTSTQTGAATISLCGGAGTDTVLAVWADNAGSCPVTQLVCNDDTCGLQSQVNVNVTAGTSYFIEIGQFNGGAGGAGTFSIAVAGPPANDDCATAMPIAGTGAFAFTNVNATTGSQGQTEPLCLAFATTGITNDVWYDWTAPSNGTATLALCGGTTMDSKVAVYAGAGCPTGAALACNDDTCSLQSQVSFGCFAGQVYSIQLGNYPGALAGSGTFTINVVSPDACADALPISGTGVFPFDTTAATTGAEGQTEAACDFFGQTAIANDVWYKWHCTTSGLATVDTCGQTGMDSKLAVYAGAGCPAGAALVCNDDTCSLQSSVQFLCTAGQDYTIQLGNYPGASSWPGSAMGTFTISVTPDNLAYCFGDGSGTACPCGNNGAAGNGCANSLFAGGSNLAATGTPSVSSDSLVLTGSSMPNSSALYFQGTTQTGGGLGTVFGDGLRCAAGAVIRLGTKINASNTSSYPVAGDQLISVRGAIPGAGAVRTYQVWYRNAAAFCTADTFNLTNGVQIIWGP